MKLENSINLENPEYYQKLVGHLKSSDLFGVANHRTSSVVVIYAVKFKDGKATVTSEITIKGKPTTSHLIYSGITLKV